MATTTKSKTESTSEDDFIYATMRNEYWYMLQLTNIYPDLRGTCRKISVTIYSIMLILITVYFVVVFPLTAYKISEDILIASQSIHYCVLVLISTVVVLSMIYKRKLLKNTLRAIGRGPQEYDEETKIKTKYIVQKYKKRREFILKLLAGYFYFVGTAVGILAPIIDSAVNGWPEKETYSAGGVSVTLPIPIWSPFGSHTTMRYLASLAIEGICIFIVASAITAGDAITMVNTQYVTMELELMTWALERTPERAIRLYRLTDQVETRDYVKISDLTKNAKLLRCYKLCLRETAQHHQRTLELFVQVNNLISVQSFMAFFCGSMIIAIDLIVLLFGNGAVGSTIIAIFLGVAEILNMFLMAWCGEEISTANDKFLKALYSTKWYYGSTSAAKTLQIILCRAQRPMVLFAGGLVPFNFETFTNVMNSAYSYFNLVYAMKADS